MVRVAYSREKEERDRAGKNEDDWKCDVVRSPPVTFETPELTKLSVIW